MLIKVCDLSSEEHGHRGCSTALFAGALRRDTGAGGLWARITLRVAWARRFGDDCYGSDTHPRYREVVVSRVQSRVSHRESEEMIANWTAGDGGE